MGSPALRVPLNNEAPETNSPPHHGEVQSLWLQRLCGWLALFPLGLLIIALIRFKFRYKIENLQAIREEFLRMTKAGRPLIVCPNHLTMVDSVLLLWAFASLRTYFFNYRLFAWNIPAIENFYKHPTWRVITFLSKCIPIDRTGGNEHVTSILKTLSGLLIAGDFCMIFPEGTRSRTGRINVEATGYGIGKIIREVPDCEVLCVYLRGEGQETYSYFPKKGESFYIAMEKITPASTGQGLRAVRDNSIQIVSKLKEMEDVFLARHGK